MNVSTSEFAAMLNPPVTRQAVHYWLKNGELVRDDNDKKIDLTHPVNVAWLQSRAENPPPPKPPNTKNPALLSGKKFNEDETDVDVEHLLAQIADLDIRTMPKAVLDKIKTLEMALKTRVDRQNKRGELIDRALVRTLFGKLYQIDSNNWRTLGANLAPEIAGALGVEDPALVLQVEQMIDDRVLRTLGFVKRTVQDTLVAWKAGELPDDI